jgi:hypothetical protein
MYKIVKSLKSLENEKWSNGAIVKFRDVDFNLLSFEEQIKIDITTDIMVYLNCMFIWIY